ncbi:hypothetical protein [Lactobacillus bombicola]|uniref:hypothetical protein n=1 Tax=Lactobacillus bombicola TaxID=1505723 RepID=UPI000E59156B|nr:hypothetical protein [Lactobacillus bombicola]RHW50997.1 hypothetical protein DS833_03280 [Lactobacillus bombicola]
MMNKKYIFWLYTAICTFLIFLARQSWSELPTEKLWQLSFGWISTPLKFALLCINVMIFDYVSIILPRNEVDSLKNEIEIRKPKILTLFKILFPLRWPYLAGYLIVHTFAITNSNLGLSLTTLALMILIWICLTTIPFYHWSLIMQSIGIFLSLLVLRLGVFCL